MTAWFKSPEKGKTLKKEKGENTSASSFSINTP
jgi:hypothetical protein